MQVSVEQKSELKRKMKVQVAEDKIQSEIDKRLDSLSKKIRIDGFRPGKVPPGIIRKRYEKPVRNEVVGELIQSSLIDALKDNDLRPAGVPAIENTVAEAGKGLEFEASFEVYPTIDLAPSKDLKIVRPVCEISDSDIDDTIEKLRQQRREWRVVERKSTVNDRLTLTFSGTAEGENFTDGEVKDFQVEIGGGRMIPGFEDNLEGLEAGDEKNFSVEFPEDYGNKKLAGKPADFKVQAQKVEEPVLPGLDEEFLKSFGIDSGDLDEFRASVKTNLEKERDRAVGIQLKTAVMDAMLDANTLVLPDVMVDQEIEQIKSQQAANNPDADMGGGELYKEVEPEARKRVTLGLLIAEVVKQNNLQPDGAKVRKMVEDLAQSYNSPEDVINWYYSNPEQLQKVEHIVLEDQVVDLVVQEAQVTDESIDFSQLTAEV